MANYKKHIGKIVGTTVGNIIWPIAGTYWGYKLGAMYDEKNEKAQQSLKLWKKIVKSLSEYELQNRKSIMFISDEDVVKVWKNKFPDECEVLYLPYSYGVPNGITIGDSHIEEGVLYVYDPRNEYRYYKASEISQILIKDKFREIKQVFESIGAVQIDITFKAQIDQKNDFNSNNSQKLSGWYGQHKASANHSGSRGGSKHMSDFRQLEIHKKCTGKVSSVNFNECYWYYNDVIFKEEVRSVKAGSTLETNFVDTTKSYCSLTATSMDKIEAEYEYMESIGVSSMVQWDKSAMQETTQEVVWDVHIVYSQDNCNDFNKNENSNEQKYIEEFKCMLEDGEIGPRERKSLDRLCERLGISYIRAAELERSVTATALSSEEQEYLDEYHEIIADGEIRDRDRRALDRLAQRNGISKSRAKELENLI